MNRIVFCLILLISHSSASIIYTVDVDRSGFSSVTVSLESEDNSSVYVPPDASSFRIVGGTYSIRNETAFIETGKTGFATFSYSTNSFTTKTASGWRAIVFPPNGSSVVISMPPYSSINNVIPAPKQLSSEDSQVSIELDYSDNVMIQYTLLPILSSQEETGFPWLPAIAIMIVVFSVAYLLFLRKKTQAIARERKPSFELTKEKKDMMDTFNENDLLIVNFLLDSGGKSKRNVLERKTGISKSSLSMALKRLEKRKIIEMDRTATTHYVKLSDYFLRL